MLQDLESAEQVLVNSEFVRQSFLERGWPPASIHVIYWGIDDAFLRAIPKLGTKPEPGPSLRMLFAGTFEARKGVDALVDALVGFDDVDWELAIAGPMASGTSERYSKLLKDPRVTVLGPLSRRQLARTMHGADVFLFPSLAEGSARVIFEALAAGMYVITTPNAGSIVEEGVHGALVAPGSKAEIRGAVGEAAVNPSHVFETGLRNARTISSEYNQKVYGDELLRLYARLGDEGGQMNGDESLRRGSS